LSSSSTALPVPLPILSPTGSTTANPPPPDLSHGRVPYTGLSITHHVALPRPDCR
jgi:hypothetical protein